MKPGLDRIRALTELLADPQEAYPIIHVAGTNGKGSVTRMAAALLAAHGLNAGAFVSPHLQHIEERFLLGNGRPMARAEFARVVGELAPLVDLYEERSGDLITYFELTAAIAFSWFAERAVEAAVVEVGLGGRLDATNVVDAEVAVLTSVGLEHTEFLGTTLAAIATEKAAILGDGKTLVSGALPPETEGVVTGRVAETGSTWRRWDTDFGVTDATQAVGGWVCDLRGVYGDYSDVVLNLHGRHQVRNFAVAVTAVEELFGRALSLEAVYQAAATVTSPGRLEVVGRRPLVVLDGAHNQQGMEALSASLAEEFINTEWTVVFGLQGERDPALLLAELKGKVGRLIATQPTEGSPRPAEGVAAAAAEVLGSGVPIEVVPVAVEAVARALAAVTETDGVLVCGSLYLVGEARSNLVTA